MINREHYAIRGEYTKVARRLKPYSKTMTTNIFRLLSDQYSFYLMSLPDHYSGRELAILSLNFTRGRDFYSGKKLITKDKILVDEKEIHRDHLFPASQGGLYAFGNVVITSENCNIQKSDMDPYEYYKFRIENNLPTLYSTLDEAYEAINFLHELYMERYPSAAEFMTTFNTLEFPFDLKYAYSSFSKLLGDLPDAKIFSLMQRKTLDMSDQLKDLDFWLEVSDTEMGPFKGLSQSSLNTLSTSRLVHTSNIFLENDLSVLETSDEKIEELVADFIDKNEKPESEYNKYMNIARKIIKHKDVYINRQKLLEGD